MRIQLFVVVMVFGRVAAANVQNNGTTMNGTTMNGTTMNGTTMNGTTMNGTTMNGTTMNGTTMNGVAINGTMLTATLVDATPSTCSHSEAATGGALASSCNACATMVCNQDAHCCSTAWDATCVSEATGICAVTAQNLVNNNGTLTANMIQPNGQTVPVTLRTNSIQQPDYYVQSCKTIYSKAEGTYETVCTTVNRPTMGPNKDVYLYKVEYLDSTNAWKPICDHTDADGYYNLSTIVRGAWETRVNAYGATFTDGVNHWTGGSKIPGTDTTSFTLACRDLGATAKCLERDGYKWWKGGTTHDYDGNPVSVASLDAAHQACVRMVRADYCGDGMPHTITGTAINVRDADGVQSYDPSVTWGVEAEWLTGSAACIRNARYSAQDPTAPQNPDGSYPPLSTYIQNHCPNLPVSGLGVWLRLCGADYDLNLDQNGNVISYLQDQSSTLQ